MWSFFLFVATISFIFGEDNDYQDLGADLPMPLAELITAIYNDKLYAIGGYYRNGTELSSPIVWNTKIYSLDLSGISLSGTDAITGNTGLSWSEVSFTGPTYGPASTSGNTANKMACRGQCYAQIGKYLYIVGPYTEEQTDNTPQTSVYRLDLSTMTFSGSSDFPSTTGYAQSTTGQCVTAIGGVLYTVGAADNSYGDFISLTPPNTQTSLKDFNGTNRFYSGCGAGPNRDDVANRKLWLLGGGAQPSVYADDYDIESDGWTIRSFNNPFGQGTFDSGDTSSSSSRSRTRCVTTLYDDKIECVGGIRGNSQLSTAVRYSTTAYETGSSENTYSDLLFALSSPGVNSYQLLDNGVNAAELMLVTGGYEGSSGFIFPASDKVQYAVRYYTVPAPPTPEPTASPTTPMPTKDPICPTCTASPTGSPTTAEPTPATESPTTAAPTDATMAPTTSTEPAGNGVAQLCMIISCVMAFLSVIII